MSKALESQASGQRAHKSPTSVLTVSLETPVIIQRYTQFIAYVSTLTM